MPMLFKQHKGVVSLIIIIASAMCCGLVLAQSTPETTSPVPMKDAVPEQGDTQLLSSEEQGKVSLDESFEPQSKHERVLEQRKKALQDTKVDMQLRSLLLNRDKFDGNQSTALTLGGYAGFKTGYFRDRIAFGATAYSSQKLYGPDDKDGTGLLQVGQQGYTVLGELYGQFRLTDGVFFDVGRKMLNTPYINKSDIRMTPNTFETAMLQGSISNAAVGSEWRFGIGYVDEMKQKTSEEFVSMAEVAGAPVGIERGVYAGGVNYKRGALSIGAVNYYSDDIINIFYTEAKYDISLFSSNKLKFSAQYSSQKSTGDKLLTGSSFSTSQFGLKTELGVGNALYTAAWISTDNGAELRSPWGSIPSYNSVQVQDFNRAGEDSLMLRAGYHFKSVPNLSAYALWVNGSQLGDASLPARDEYDFNVQWLVGNGIFKGLSVRVRYALVTQDIGGPDLQDFRLIFNYDPTKQ